MNKLKKVAVVLAIITALTCSFAGCTPDNPDVTEDDTNVTLRIAAGYNSTATAISFQDSKVVGDGITLADGNTYILNDLKPTWKYISEELNITIEDKYTGKKAAEEFSKWDTDGLDQVDIVAGSASALTEAGAQGKLIDLNANMDKMPNFQAYLEENEIARLSITGNTSNGAIYFSPYFDGVDDIEKMPLMRADMVRALLDGDTAYTGADRAVNTQYYKPYMPTTGSVEVESLTADGTAKQTIKKDYSKYGNIIDKMNLEDGLKGNAAVAMFRKYIDDTYGTTYDNRSDLFLGYDAAWDADELVALLRCAVASLNDDDGNAIKGIFSRETSNLNRDVDILRFAGTLFGVRGLESRQDYLYFDTDGNLHDARQESDTFDVALRMNSLVKEGLIVVDGSAASKNYLAKDAGIVSYDYNQTQTIMNDTMLNDGSGANDTTETGEEYIPVMVPVAKWDDGDATTPDYFRFTESWRSVKTEGWALSKAGIGDDEAKLNKALKLIDFAFSVQGQITMSYGPDAFIKVKDASVEVNTWEDVEKKYETFDFNGKKMPVISDGSYASLQELTSGNYTDYARKYLGSTLNGFPKSQAFEYQCTNEIGKKGAAILSSAIAQGIIKHPLLSINTENMWYTSVPTTFPTTTTQSSALTNDCANLTTYFKQEKGAENVFWYLLTDGQPTVAGFATGSSDDMASYVESTWNGSKYLLIKTQQWLKLQVFYDSL